MSPLLAFGLGAFAAAAAVRQLVLSTRRLGWRGLVGRANGGMIVHLGVVMVAVAFAATQAYAHRAEFRLSPGQTAHLAGHRVTYLGSSTVKHPNRTSLIDAEEPDLRNLEPVLRARRPRVCLRLIVRSPECDFSRWRRRDVRQPAHDREL